MVKNDEKTDSPERSENLPIREHQKVRAPKQVIQKAKKQSQTDNSIFVQNFEIL